MTNPTEFLRRVLLATLIGVLSPALMVAVGVGLIGFGGWLNPQGSWALVLVGDVVLAFTILDVAGLRKTSRVLRTGLDSSRA